MPDFICHLVDNSGKTTNATHNSVSELELRQRLEGQGFYIYSIKKKVRNISALLPFLSGRRKIKSRDFIIFNQQFVALVGAGIPILKALELLAKREKEEQFQVILRNVTEQVKAGSLLSEAFETQESFSKVYTASVYAGEKSGNLEQVLKRFIQYQKTINTTRSKIRSALTYPLILASLLVILVSYLIAVVVPQFAQFYAGMDAELPSITQFLVTISQSINNQFFTGIFVIGLVIGCVSMWARGKRGRIYFDDLKLRFLIIGDIWRKFLFAQISRTLSTLLSGGIPLVNSLDIVSASTGNLVVTGALKEAVISVKEGQSLARSLEGTQVVPGLAIEMIEVGESSGNLSEMLGHVADFYDDEVSTRLDQLFTYIEPILLLILAVIVAFVLIALYLPIFSLSSRIMT